MTTPYRKRQQEVEQMMAEARERAAMSPSYVRPQTAVPVQAPPRQEQQGGGMNPMSLFNNGLMGDGGLRGLFGGGGSDAALSAWTGPANSMATGGASGGASAGGGFGSALSAAGPYAAIAALIGLNENYQHNIGNREGESFPLEYGITGRAAYKDKDVWGDKADDIIPGLGSGIRIAGGMSSPIDMFRGDTWKDVFDELKSGGLLGGLLGL